MTRHLVLGAALTMIGCSPVPPAGADQPPIHDEGACDASKAQLLVGEPASSEAAAKAQQLTGAGVVRWLQPGQVVTMEYRSDRLNLVLDEANRITAIRCG